MPSVSSRSAFSAYRRPATGFPDAPKTPEERGPAMRRILVEQAELLKKVTGDPAHNGSWFEHSDLINGGTLLLQTGPRPNKAWGSRPEAAPPSLSQ